MAGDRRSPSIADDWSEIDDSGSVKSAASFDDDDEFCLLPEFNKPPLPPKPVTASSPTKSDAENDKAPKPADNFEKQPLYASTHQHKQPEVQPASEPVVPTVTGIDITVRKADAIEKTPTEPTTAPIPIASSKRYPGKTLADDQVVEPEKEETAEDDVHEDDPNYYYQFLVELHHEMGEIISTTENIKLSDHPTVLLTRATCRDLQNLLGELKLIYAAYAGSWVTDGSEIPLSPDLLVWMHTVNLELDTLKPTLTKFGLRQHQFEFYTQPTNTLSEEKVLALGDLAECCENLDGAKATFENFLPIIKTDFDEFKTRSMSFPRYQAPAAPAAPATEFRKWSPDESRKESRREPPSPAISRIRRELYSLKDELQTTLVFMSKLQHEIPEGTLPDAINAVRAMRDLVVVISTMLTNNGSDWLDRDLGSSHTRTIPYANFVNLDPDILYDVTKHLQEFYAQLDVRSEPLFRQYSSTMIRNHQITSLVEGGQMYNLLSIISLLESILMEQN